MKTILFTGWDEPYEELSKVTGPKMFFWARRNNYGFHTFGVPPPGLNIYWTGVARGLQLLREGVDRIMYLDVDQLITNPGASIEYLPKFGFHCSKDWGNDATEPWHFSACGWIAHQDCIPMFEEVLAMAQEWMDKPFQEQGPWQAWMKKRIEGVTLVPNLGEPNKPKIESAGINVHPRSLFNNVPEEVSPGNVPEPWQPGDFAAHLTMLPMEERLKLARKLMSC